jgi:hypothetical protein
MNLPVFTESKAMLYILSHVTPTEFPLGVAMFLGGIGVGIGISAFYMRYFRSR